MPESSEFDLVIVGGGPAGYVGAIRAAQLGMRVACVERDKLGGVCLNWGCIPTKSLLAGAEFYQKLKHEADAWGIEADNVRHDWKKVIGRSRQVTGTLNQGIHGLFRKNKIEHIAGSAKIMRGGPACQVDVSNLDDSVTHRLTSRHLLICTGASPRGLPGVAGLREVEFDGQRIISSKEAMTLSEQPEKLLIIGAGAIGMEFAYFYNAFDTQVTVIEMLDHVLPNEDVDVSRAVAHSFKKQGITCLTGAKTTSVTPLDGGVQVRVAPVGNLDDVQVHHADRVLIAVGVKGNHESLFDPSLPIQIEHDHIKVDRNSYQTSVTDIYAAGDVIGPPWLAHVASEEAITCIERLAGHEPIPIDYDSIPGCTYCLPQVASLGKTEQSLKKQGLQPGTDYRVGKFPFQASGKAQALGSTEGFIKILTDSKHGEILGVHMVGESVTELLAEMGLARRLEATTDELIATMHAHPTLSEAVHEAALGAAGRMMHF